jgi:hypothetical protein
VIDAIAKQLGEAGPAWALTGAVIAIMAWIVKSLLSSWIAERVKLWDFVTASTKAQQETAEALRAIRDNCRSCREDSLRSLRDEAIEIKRAIEERNTREVRGEVRELSEALLTHPPAPVMVSEGIVSGVVR